MLHCPFCGADETDRLDLEGRRFVVFACMFTPEVDRSSTDVEIAAALSKAHPGGGTPYFRGMCDRLHLYVTVGEGGRRLTSTETGTSTRPPAAPDAGRPD